MARARGLTGDEIELLRPLFAGSIDYDAVRLHPRRYLPFQPADVAMAPNGAVFYPAAHFSSDFAAQDLERRTWFVHEMVHVWQHQNRVMRDLRLLGAVALGTGLYGRAGPVSGAAGRYLYDYDHCIAEEATSAALELGDFGFEQQAMIIEDYYRARHGGNRIGLARFVDPHRGLLRHFLKDPAYLRHRRSWRIVFPPSLVHDRGAL